MPSPVHHLDLLGDESVGREEKLRETQSSVTIWSERQKAQVLMSALPERQGATQTSFPE